MKDQWRIEDNYQSKQAERAKGENLGIGTGTRVQVVQTKFFLYRHSALWSR